jgi:hypothetical protein
VDGTLELLELVELLDLPLGAVLGETVTVLVVVLPQAESTSAAIATIAARTAMTLI